MSAGRRNTYNSMKEFEREELAGNSKAGWSLDDLYQEANYKSGDDPSLDYADPKELDFDT